MNEIPPSFRVAAVQACCSSDVGSNIESAVHSIEQAAGQGAKIVCLQELFASRYFCQTENHQNFELAEPVPGPLTQRLMEVGRDNGVVIVAGVFERRAQGVYHNTAIVVDADGSLVGKYRKMHIPDDPNFKEKFYFTPGDLGFCTFQTAVGKVGVCICWDQWFPEAARLTALRGAELIVYPTAIGWLEADEKPYGESQVSAWKTMMRSHAIANGVFVVAPNRVGIEDDIEFWGNSFVADPYGNVLAEADRDGPQTIYADCEPQLIDQARTHWPFLRDRRIDAFDDLTRRYIDEEPHG